MKVTPRTWYFVLVVPFVIWGMTRAAASAWTAQLEPHPPTALERVLMAGSVWVFRQSPYVVLLAFIFIPIATLVGPYVVQPPKHTLLWVAVFLSSVVVLVAITPPMIGAVALASCAAASGVSMAGAYHAQRSLVARDASCVAPAWLPIMAASLQGINILLGLIVLLVPVLGQRGASASGGAVQRADAADEPH